MRRRKKKWVSYFHRTAQPHALAPFPAWGIQQELVVKDLPDVKVRLIFILQFILQILSEVKAGKCISNPESGKFATCW